MLWPFHYDVFRYLASALAICVPLAFLLKKPGRMTLPMPSSGQAAKLFEEGQQLLDQRCVEQALEYFESARRAGFDTNLCAASLWNCWMYLGRFERAWQESDRIAASGAPDPHRFWTGESWQGKRVMLRCLHGLGDTLQFIRFVPSLKNTCKSVTVQAHPELLSLLGGGLAGADHVMTWGQGETEPAWDMQMEVNELPRAFRITIDSLSTEVPYIHVSRERVDWAARLFPERHGLRIGVLWRSGPWDSSRSIPLEQMAELSTYTDHQYFHLQEMGSGVAAAHRFQSMEQSDIRDLAAVMMNLDLIITVDTMAAHLAGALGRPVWILLPFRADWRWMLKRSDTPWYPTARLFRQTSQDDWSGVIVEVANQLKRGAGVL